MFERRACLCTEGAYCALRERAVRKRTGLCQAGVVVKNDGEERAVNRDVALYSMNASSRNLFMKKLTRSWCPRLGEYLRQEPSAAAAAGLPSRRARQPLLSGVEELIDQVFFDADVSRQHVRQESFRQRGLLVEHLDHLRLLDHQPLLELSADEVDIRRDCPARQPSRRSRPGRE